MFQNITQIVKNKLLFNDSKWRRMTLSLVKKLLVLLRGLSSKNQSEFYFLNCVHSFETENECYKNVCQKTL